MSDEQPPPRRRRGSKPRGRTVSIMSITVTPEQKAALEALADAHRVTISAIIRQLIDASLIPPVTELIYVENEYNAGRISLTEVVALLTQIVHNTNAAIDLLSALVPAIANRPTTE